MGTGTTAVMMRLALNDDAIVVIVVAVNEEGEDEGEEEHDAVPGLVSLCWFGVGRSGSTYMIPKTHEALSMAQDLSTFSWGKVPLMVKPKKVASWTPDLPQLEQSASAMTRSS